MRPTTVVKSKSSAVGYLSDAQSTEQTFNWTLDGGYLRTGDLGYCDDAQVYVVGRMKDLIKVRGLSFVAEDIELAMLQREREASVPVHACAAVGIEASAGEVTSGMMEVDAEVLDDAALRALAHGVKQRVCDTSGLVLQDVLFLTRGQLPKTPSGKVKRGACKELYATLQAQTGALAASLS